jgi:hypothetical protein
MKFKDFVPPVAMNLYRAFLRVRPFNGQSVSSGALMRRTKKVLSKNEDIINRHEGKRCFILATGSSIENQDLTLLKDEICIGLNEFFLHSDYHTIRPAYLVFSGFGLHPKIPAEKRIPWYKNYEECTRGVSSLFLNISDFELIRENDLMTSCDVRYLKYECALSSLSDLGLNPTKRIYSSASVSIMALQIALIMGFKDIVLVGFDHDWLLRMFDDKPTHFYKHEKSIIYKGISEVKGISVISELKSLTNLFESYYYLKNFADKKQVCIYNATAGGILDVFPRVDLDSLLSKTV